MSNSLINMHGREDNFTGLIIIQYNYILCLYLGALVHFQFVKLYKACGYGNISQDDRMRQMYLICPYLIYKKWFIAKCLKTKDKNFFLLEGSFSLAEIKDNQKALSLAANIFYFLLKIVHCSLNVSCTT